MWRCDGAVGWREPGLPSRNLCQIRGSTSPNARTHVQQRMLACFLTRSRTPLTHSVSPRLCCPRQGILFLQVFLLIMLVASILTFFVSIFFSADASIGFTGFSSDTLSTNMSPEWGASAPGPRHVTRTCATVAACACCTCDVGVLQPARTAVASPSRAPVTHNTL